MLTGWRIAQPEFARSPDQMLSGEGAYLFGGRWNSKGVRVVYLGTSLAQAAMELLVHIDRPALLADYHKLSVSFNEAHVSHIDILDLPDDWAEPTMASSVRQVGDRWVHEGSSLVLQVPSACVGEEYNFLLNPTHSDFRFIQIGEISKFRYDPRLQK
ncbi:RES family NAD+ phosphorylase [Allohahella sp. A8]|uniref:RES family NAD+ phosphorylase n=1 Tax=Allohahella sp. A8 TaxID=3141461 RepID=UPI003A7FC63D